MTSFLRIACLSLIASREAVGNTAMLPHCEIEWDVIPVEPDLEHIAARIKLALAEYDAVALDGLFASIHIGKETYHHEYVWKMLEMGDSHQRVSDGSGLQTPLERYLVSQAAAELAEDISGKRILMFSGLHRYGSADVLRHYSKQMTFGDMLYGFRLGIPIKSFAMFESAAPSLAQAAVKAPKKWYWPTARKHAPVLPKYQRYIRRADVIVGGISYFKRYMPDSLAGKIIFTNIHSKDEVEMFAERGAKCVVSLTPVIDGCYVPLAVLEAALLHRANSGQRADLENYFLAEIQQLDLQPHIVNLEAKGHEDFALVDLPERAPKLPEPDASDETELTATDAVSKFCFVVHPLSLKDIMRLKVVRIAQKFLPKRLIEDAAAHINPWPVGVLRNVKSSTGAQAEGLIYALPMTSKAIMRFPPEFMYKRLTAIATEAQARGCKLMGLGAYTSVAGDAGVTVAKRSPIGITSGNSYTVAATLRTMELAAKRAGIDVANAHVLIVGATGSIGSVCARLVATRVAKLYLASPRPEKLLTLARQIEGETPQMAGCIELSSNPSSLMGKVDCVITTTSAVDPIIDITALKPGCLVLDVARPPDISREAAAERDDVLVIESGEVLLPEGAELTVDIGLADGVIYPCLAETLLLALDGRFGDFTVGREIDPAKVNLIGEIGDKHGFKLAPIRSFGEVVAERRFARLREINSESGE